MKARRNLLSTVESFLERVFQAPFKFLPSRLEPIELGHKLERVMDDNKTLRHDGQFIVPNVYDIYVSEKDYQELSLNLNRLIEDWQEQLRTYAHHRQYVISDNNLILHLEVKPSLNARQVEIKALEPLGIGRNLERAMDDNKVERHGKRFVVPNTYNIYVSIKDHQYLSSKEGILSRGWQEQLISYARHHQYLLSVDPIVHLHPRTSLKEGQVVVEVAADEGPGGHAATQALNAEQLAKLQAQFLQNQQAKAQGMPQGAAPTSGVSAPNQPVSPRYQGSAPTIPPTSALPHAQLTIALPQGGQQVYRIEKPVVSIGRQLDNDIVVEDKRVGRYHAQVKFDGQQFTIIDLGSTNGTLINRILGVHQHVLRNGDVFTIGGYDFHYERR